MAGGNIVRMIFAGDATDLLRSMRQASGGADDMADDFESSTGRMAVAGAALGAAVVAGFATSLDADTASKKLEAQLGRGTPEAEQAGRLQGKVYADAYGESLGQVGEALRSVLTTELAGNNPTDEALERMTKNALSLADAFDQDVSPTISAASQLLRTGLARDGDHALDILATGFTKLGPRADDLLDTFTEYGTQFRTLGLSGEDALGLISQGLKSGARDTDVVADALKEFALIAVDSTGSAGKGFKTLGIDAEQAAEDILKGGPAAREVVRTTLDALNQLEDPVARNNAGLQLFGTKWEDLQDAIDGMDLDTITQELGEVEGAAQGVNDTLGESVQSKLDAAKRGFEEWKNSIVGVQGPLGDVAAWGFTFGADAITLAGNIGLVAIALRGLGAGSILSSIGGVAASVLGIGTAADTARNGGVSRLRGALRFAGAVAAIGLVTVAFDEMSKEARESGDDFNGWGADVHEFARIFKGDFTELARFPDDISEEWDQLVGNIQSGRAPIVQVFSNIGQTAQNIFKAMSQAAAGDWAGAVETIRTNMVRIPGTASAVSGDVRNSFGTAISIIKQRADDLRNAISRPIGVNVTFNPVVGAINNAIARVKANALANIPKFHDGGVMPGGPNTEGLALLKGGETVLPPGAEFTSGPPLPRMSGSMTVTFAGNTDSAFATAFQRMVREGKIQVS